ncbi:MAG TPA: cation-transporting P-type ATPase [Atopostipes sp.]|nr:cation-transporting P-type ATPase [Atopostipes sp.]
MAVIYQKSVEEVVQELETDIESGLTKEEVERRREEYGLNELEEHETKPWYEILLENLNNIIVYLLAAAAILSVFMGEYIEAIAIVLAILISVLTGFFVEWRAAQSVDALQEMVQTTVDVLRDKEEYLNNSYLRCLKQ